MEVAWAEEEERKKKPPRLAVSCNVTEAVRVGVPEKKSERAVLRPAGQQRPVGPPLLRGRLAPHLGPARPVDAHGQGRLEHANREIGSR